MARINTKAVAPRHTHEGAVACVINSEKELRRSVMACMLWEDQFYEDGQSIADRIAGLIKQTDPKAVAKIAVEARTAMKLRHVPLLLARELARGTKEARLLVADTLAEIIQRPDELTEFLALYWKDGKQPLSAQVKKGLARAFNKFSAYSLAKYNRDENIKLRDVLFLSHAKPKDAEQTETFKKLVEKTLESPDTWEVALSAGKDKKETFERLIAEKKLGGLALLRNLRNMTEAKVSNVTIAEALRDTDFSRVLPFRFISAAKYAPHLEPAIEQAMLKALESTEKLPGKTILIVDTSGSMYGAGNVSKKSELSRVDAAAALAVLIREICEEPVVYATAGDDDRRIHATKLIPARRGFALRDKICNQSLYQEIGGGGIFLTQCMDYVYKQEGTADRIIVLTDEQDCDQKLQPQQAKTFGKHNYLINVASYQNGIGYGKWIHIDGWSEAVVEYIRAAEAEDADL